jgi:hypothetical protein
VFTFLASKSTASNSYLDRMKRMRSAGYERGEAEAKLFKLAVGNDFNRWQAISWINDATDDGLNDLRAQARA